MNRLKTRLPSVIQFVDQGASSLVNLVITLVVARSLGTDGLGSFNFPFAVLISLLGLQRAALIEPVMASKGAKPYMGCLIYSVYVGAGVMATGILISVATNSETVRIWSLAIPVMLFYDVVRYISIHAGSNWVALTMDCLWLAGTSAMLIRSPSSLFLIVAAWASLAVLGLIFGLFWFFRAFRVADVRESMYEFRQRATGLSTSSFFESIIYQFTWQLPLASLLAVIGLSESAEYRGALTIMAPAGVLVSAWSILSYAKHRNEPGLWLPYRLASVTTSYSLIYLSMVLVLLPVANRLLFGDPEFVGFEIMLLVGIQLPLISWSSQFAVYLKIAREARLILLSRSISSLLVGVMFAWGLVEHSGSTVIFALPAGMALFAALLMLWQYRTNANSIGRANLRERDFND